MGLPPGAPMISVGDHLYEVPEMFAGCKADDPPRLVESDDGSRQAWHFGRAQVPLEHFPMPRGSQIAKTVAEMPDCLRGPEARLEAMDRNTVHTHLLFPHAMGFAGEFLLYLGDGPSRLATAQAYNNYAADVYHAAAPDRLVSIAIVPLDDPEAAAAELRRAVKLGARGLSLPCSPAVIGLPSYHEDHWEPLLCAADECDMPIFIHVATMRDLGPMVSHGSTPGGPLGAVLTLYNLDVMTAIVEIAFSPILVRHPNLKVVTVEGGAGWFPYLLDRIDNFWSNRGDRGRGPGTVRDRPPSELLRNSVMMSLIEDPAAIRNRAEIGVERMMWMSDFPHEDGFYPKDREYLEKLLADVPEDEAVAIASGNAAKLLRVNVG